MSQKNKLFKSPTVVLLIVALVVFSLMATFILRKPSDQPKAAPGVPTLSFAIDPATVQSGQDFDLVVKVNPNGASFNAFELYFSYDPVNLEFQNLQNPSSNISSPFILINGTADPVNHWLEIVGTRTGTPFTGNLNYEIARVKLRVTNPDSDFISFGWDGETRIGNRIARETVDAAFPITRTNNTPVPTIEPRASLLFKVSLPDVVADTVSLSDAEVTLKSANSVIGTFNTALVKDGNYYRTPQAINFNNISDDSYQIFLKTRISVGRLYSNINLTPGQSLDCTVNSNSACGELVSGRDSKILFSGDSDGFDTVSGSYNRVDSADLQVLTQFYNQNASGSSPSADFNLDGQVDISDLEIIGRNYAIAGD